LKIVNNKANYSMCGYNRSVTDDDIIKYRKLMDDGKTVAELNKIYDINPTTLSNIQKRQMLTKEEMDNNITYHNNEDVLDITEIEKEVKEKYVDNNKMSKTDFSNWKRSYKNKLKKGLTIPIIIEILNQKGKNTYENTMIEINKKYNLVIKKQDIISICVGKLKLYLVEIDLLSQGNITIQKYEEIMKMNHFKELVKSDCDDVGRKKNYTKDDENEIVTYYTKHPKNSLVKIMGSFGIDRNIVSKMRETAREMIGFYDD
jgi:hypothetical protein